MPQFEISTYPSQLFWLAVIFTLLYVVVRSVIAPKAEKIMANRENLLQENVKEAEEAASRAKDLEREHAKILKQSMDFAESTKKQAIYDFEKSFEAKMQDLMRNLDSEIKLAEADIDKTAQEYNKNKKIICVDVTAAVIEKIIKEPVNHQLLKDCYEVLSK